MNDSLRNSTVTHEKTSVLLKRISSGHTTQTIQFGILLFRLRRRSFGGLLFFLALLSLIPGISILTGLLIIVLGLQLMIGFRSPRLPKIWNDYRINAGTLTQITNSVIPRIQLLEKFVKPRLAVFTELPFTLLLGFIIASLAVVIMIPLPFTGLLPVLALLLIALGLLERDGVIICIATVVAFISLLLGFAITRLVWQSIIMAG